MRESFLVQSLTSLLLLSYFSTVAADTANPVGQKPMGISLEWYQHELDLDVTDIETSIPGITDAMVDAVKGRLNTTDTLKMANLRLDYQWHPALNVYAAVGKLTDDTTVDFSSLGAGISDLVINNKGTAYAVGTKLQGQYGKVLPSLQYMHSRIDLDGNDADIKVNALIPSVGLQTDYGMFDASLVYQAVEASYAGTVVAPFVGEVPVTVRTENKDKLQVMAGWQTQLAKDLYLKGNIGLNGQQQFQLQLNKRF